MVEGEIAIFRDYYDRETVGELGMAEATTGACQSAATLSFGRANFTHSARSLVRTTAMSEDTPPVRGSMLVMLSAVPS